MNYRLLHTQVCRYLALAILAACVAVSVGCSQKGLGATAAGRVTLDGKPIGPGFISFVPVGETRNPAQGEIQFNGTYSVETAHMAGLPPGKYRVAVHVYQQQPGVDPHVRQMEMPPLVHPEKYASTDTSGLEYEIAPGDNTINVELNSE
jgi:hypothetical protein